jgi:hypothetical protein
MTIRTTLAFLLGALLVAMFVGCNQQPAADTPRIEEKRLSLKPAKIPVEVGVLAGQLRDLHVVKRVNATTGEVVYPAQLQGKLTLKNTSTDQAVTLIDGNVEFLDSRGKPIQLREGRGTTTIRVTSYGSDRLDPGAEISRDIDVPFPEAAVKARSLADVRLNLTYIPTDYHRVSTTVGAELGGG